MPTSSAHSSGQSGRSRRRNSRGQISQLTSVEASRPTVTTSAMVQGSGAMPNSRYSRGGTAIVAW